MKWIKRFPINENPLIITGSNDKTAIIWSAQESIFTPLFQLKSHKCSVTSVDGIQFNDGDDMVLYSATTSTDSTIKIWKKPHRNGMIFKSIQ